MNLRCVRCGRPPEEIAEYVVAAEEETDYGHPTTPSEYVIAEEGTLNHETGLFACTACYIALGGPVRPGGWTP
jgi:hypothetical protein